jgi:hypothetical protein
VWLVTCLSGALAAKLNFLIKFTIFEFARYFVFLVYVFILILFFVFNCFALTHFVVYYDFNLVINIIDLRN